MANRPLTMNDFIGQERVKMQLQITMGACRKNDTAMPHILLAGNPGLGKTTLAQIIANEFGTNLHLAMGGNLITVEAVQALLAPMNDNGGDVVFIDEIHRLPTKIEEMLYLAMEDNEIEMDIGAGMKRYWIPKFTLIGATTISGSVSRPLRDRFGLHFQLQNYQLDEVCKILSKLSEREKIKIDRDAINEIAKRAKGVARIAINLLHRCKEYADYLSDGVINGDIATKQFELMEIDEIGLNANDIKILKYLGTQLRPVGMSALCSACEIDIPTIENIIEPYLVQVGMVNRTRSGREITERGLAWIGVTVQAPVLQSRGTRQGIERLGAR